MFQQNGYAKKTNKPYMELTQSNLELINNNDFNENPPLITTPQNQFNQVRGNAFSHPIQHRNTTDKNQQLDYM